MVRLVAWVALLGLAYLGYGRVEEVFSDRSAELAESRLRIEELADEVAARDERLNLLGAELEQTTADLEQTEAELLVTSAERDEARLANTYLKVDRRRARLRVLEQRPDPEQPDQLLTTLEFQELDAAGRPLGEPVEGEIEGRFAYVESLVIKFTDDYVERGDAWRGQSLCLFRRVYGDEQAPVEGFTVDPEGLEPGAYRDDSSPDLSQELWSEFWDLAHDPAAAKAKGVRAMHGEAPFMEVREGSSYLVELRNSGGLTLRREGR